MAKMIPDYIDETYARRNGERLVFDWFSKDEIPGTVYYSLLQKNHIHKLIGEVDFLHVSERGFLCIEVKGGQNIYCENKTWHSINRFGEDNVIKNPFVQAKDCSYSLKRYFKEIYGKDSPQCRYLVGYAVIFPECKFTGTGNDLVTDVVFDAGFNLSDFPDFIKRIYDYWETQEYEKHDLPPKKLTEKQLNQANDLLRGDFHVVPSMHLQFQHIEQKMIQLTEEQYDILDIVDDNSRVIIRGTAGTGKTLLAIELMRKYAAKGKNVLYLCYNRNMALYVSNSVKNRDHITISTYHALIINELGLTNVFDRGVGEISDIFLSSGCKCQTKYDVLIVDEGQDLLQTSVIEVLNSFLNGGLETNCWTLFMDSNQNIFNRNEEYELTMEYIQEFYHPVIYQLKTNCRNTEQIARRTSVITLSPPAKHLRLSGPNVVTRIYSDEKEFLKFLRTDLIGLFTSGVAAEDIVILSRHKKSNSLLSKQKQLCNLSIYERNEINETEIKCLNYFTVQSFKGLESKIVFLIDIDGFGSEKDRRLNYIGMSRAKFQLYLYFSESIRDQYEKIMCKGEDLLC